MSSGDGAIGRLTGRVRFAISKMATRDLESRGCIRRRIQADTRLLLEGAMGSAV